MAYLTQEELDYMMRNHSLIKRKLLKSSPGGFSLVHDPSMTFASPGQAQRYLDQLGVTGIHYFPGSTGRRIDMPMNGPNRIEYLAQGAMRNKIDIVRYSLRPGEMDMEAITSMIMRGGVSYGIFNPGAKSASLTKGIRNGVELTEQELSRALAFHNRTYTNQTQSKLEELMQKTAKRRRAVLSEGIYQMTPSTPWTVGVFDPMNDPLSAIDLSKAHPDIVRGMRRGRAAGFVRGRDPRRLIDAAINAVQRGEEGASIINPHRLDDMARDMFNLSDEFRRSGDIETAKKIRRKASELRRVKKTGGRFNIRLSGFNVEALDGHTSAISNILANDPKLAGVMSFLLKGDAAFTVGSLKDFGKGGKFYGKDVVTSVYNLTTEQGFGPFVSLEPHKVKFTDRTDIQSFLAHRHASELPRLLRATAEDASAFTRALEAGDMSHPQIRGFISQMSELAFQEMPDNVVGDAIAEAAWIQQRGLAIDITDIINSGYGIDNNPGLVSLLGRAYKGSMIDTKSVGGQEFRQLNLRIPDSMQGYLTTQSWAKRMGWGGSLAEGEAAWSKELGFIVRNESLASIHEHVLGLSEAWGGPDMDDLMRNSLRFDPATGRLIIPSMRSPTGVGEIAAFSMNPDTDLVEDILRSRPTTETQAAAARIDLLSRRIATLSNQAVGAGPDDPVHKWIWRREEQRKALRLRASEQFFYNSSVNEIMQGSVANLSTRPMLPGSLADNEALKRLNRYHAALSTLEITKPSILGDLVASASADNARALAAQELFDQTQGLLGQASNVRMLIESTLRAIPEGTDMSGFTVQSMGKIVEMETLVDSMINAASPEVLRQLQEAIPETAESLGHLNAHLHSLGVTSLDPVAFAERKGAITSRVEAGLRASNAALNLEDVMMSPNDPRAVYSRAIAASNSLIGSVSEKIDEIVRNTTFSNAIENATYTTEEMDRAAALLDRYEEARAHFGSIQPTGEELQDIYHQLGSMPDPAGIASARTERYFLSQLAESMPDGMADNAFARTYGAAMVLSRERGMSPSMWYGNRGGYSTHAITNWVTKTMDSGAFGPVDPTRAPDASRILRDLRATGGIPGIGKASASAAAAAAAESVANAGTYSRIFSDRGKQIISEAWDLPGIKKGAALLGGLAIFSEVYRRAKDPSPDDFAGPPMLPGGSFYEDLFMAERPEMNYGYAPNSAGGITYRISGRGSGDAAAFRSQAESMTGAQASGTMYNKSSSIGDMFSTILGGF